MSHSGPTYRIRVLITVKAYPEPSKSYGESVCIAGILLEPGHPRFVRLYPVDFRGLPGSMQFHTYDIIECEVRRPRHDTRPESLCPIRDTIRVIDRVGDWEDRRSLIEPHLSHSMCDIYEHQKQTRTSLGVFRPAEILDFEIAKATPWDDGKVAATNQTSLLETPRHSRPLEQIPYDFRFRYRCQDCRSVEPHGQKLISWELGESYRKTAGRHTSERIAAVKRRWLDQVCGPSRDPLFFVGNLHNRPQTFVVIGVFWPPKIAKPQGEPLSLFPADAYR